MNLPIYLQEKETTEEAIRKRMLGRVSNEWDKSQGSYIWDAEAPVALELAMIAEMARTVLNLGFAETSESDYLTMRAAEHGIIRRPATKAVGKITITGKVNSKIPAGIIVATESDSTIDVESVYFQTTTMAVLDENGVAMVTIEALKNGTIGMVAANTINVLDSPRSDITSIANPLPTENGVEEENDQTLLERYLDYVRNPGTSGNKAHYRQWALRIPGVSAVRVFPIWDGEGTVKVVILGPDRKPPDDALVQAVKEYICETDQGDGQAPIGATPTIIGAIPLEINIRANVVLVEGVEIEAISQELTALMQKHLNGQSFDSDVVIYTKLTAILSSLDGVKDYTDFLLNGKAENIIIDQNEVAVVGTVSLHVG